MDKIFETAAQIEHLIPYLISLKKTEQIKPYQTGTVFTTYYKNQGRSSP